MVRQIYFCPLLALYMKIDKIVSITGKPGLYRVLAETPKQIIVESLEDRRKRFPVSSNFQISLLDKITIFTSDNSDLFLGQVFDLMEKSELPLPSVQDSPAGIREYFKATAPNHNEAKVFMSDLKKILKWFTILNQTGENEKV